MLSLGSVDVCESWRTTQDIVSPISCEAKHSDTLNKVTIVIIIGELDVGETTGWYNEVFEKSHYTANSPRQINPFTRGPGTRQQQISRCVFFDRYFFTQIESRTLKAVTHSKLSFPPAIFAAAKVVSGGNGLAMLNAPRAWLDIFQNGERNKDSSRRSSRWIFVRKLQKVEWNFSHLCVVSKTKYWTVLCTVPTSRAETQRWRKWEWSCRQRGRRERQLLASCSRYILAVSW